MNHCHILATICSQSNIVENDCEIKHSFDKKLEIV